MVKIVPVVQLAAHAKSSTLYGRFYCRTVVQPNFFGLMGYYYFVWLWGYAGAPLLISSASCVTLKEDNLVFLNDVCETEKLG